MSLSFYQELLKQLIHVPNPTCLMKRIINTLQSDTEKVYIYDINPTYASLFLSDDTSSIYFYTNLECSRLKPPDEHYTPHWSKWIDTSNAPKLDLAWIHSILNMNAKERQASDNLMPQTVCSVSPVNNISPVEPVSPVNHISPVEPVSPVNHISPVIHIPVISKPKEPNHLSVIHSPKQLNYIKKINSILSPKPPRITNIKARPVWK